MGRLDGQPVYGGNTVSSRGSVGFGGVLIGLGAGYILFNAMKITGNIFAWILILGGSSVIASSLITWRGGDPSVGRLLRGLTIGLVFFLFMTSGPVYLGDIFEWRSYGSYRAEETRSFDGSLATVGVLLDINTFNGPISVSTWPSDGYSVSVLVKVLGNTDAEAEENLDEINISIDESVVNGKTRLLLRHDVPPTRTSQYSLSVEAYLPEDMNIDLDLDSSNGGIYLADIVGGAINLDTSNGALNFDGVTATTVNADTSNGAVLGDLESPDTSISTSNGAIRLGISGAVSGRYVLRTSNGGVDLYIQSSLEVGYDIDLSTSNGNIDLDLPGLDYIQSTRTRKEARTIGYSEKAIQIVVKANTSNAGMDVRTG